ESQFGPSGFDYSLTNEFFWGIARAAKMTIHFDTLAKGNNHHLCEAAFKSFGRALSVALSIDPRRQGVVPSTKGAI
ncbi:MAG: imidazoleglycerol-phosphate dehydratase, partial [Myxococcales bacterium]|nr:imidazoleglycerol-phosphate dehydratase [Myxococcales bacterium]